MIIDMCVVVVCLEALLRGAARGARAPRRQHRDVSTTQGLVRGYRQAQPPHYQYLGLPYAGPPTGDDRFKAPQQPPSWDGIFEATHRVACPQPDMAAEPAGLRVDENCLVLNIFAPDVQGTLPVMVYIHDGGFYSGWGSLDPPARLLRQGVVVVTLNYRLGALGFLCLGAAAAAPGNAGLKDQVAALYWLQRNVLQFRGDPEDVTLYGTGAGAASIQLLLLSPATAGLYHKAILESGSALSPLSLIYNPISTAKEVAAALGFEGGKSMAELVEFYQSISYRELSNFSKSFRPCIEDSLYLYSLIENDPREALLGSPIVDVPLLFLHTDQEILSLIDEVPQEWYEKADPYVHELLPGNLDIENEDTLYKVLETAIDVYFARKPDTRSVQRYVDLYSDTYIVYPLVTSALMHAARSSHLVYLMRFSYEGNLSNHKSEPLPGASHGDIMNYVFSRENLDNVHDETVADQLIFLWMNFIKFGDPTPLLSSKVPVIWQPVRVSMHVDGSKAIAATQCLAVEADMKLALQTPYANLEFWEKIYRVFYKKHVSLVDGTGKT